MESIDEAQHEVARNDVVPSLRASLCIKHTLNAASLRQYVVGRDLDSKTLVFQHALADGHVPDPFVAIHRSIGIARTEKARQVRVNVNIPRQ